MSDLDRHDHAHGEESTLTDIQKRVKALESILVSKGLVERAVIDQIIEHFERRVGPHVGARVVARAWTDQQFKRALLEDATKAINLQSDFPEVGQHLIAVENSDSLHNVVVCTLCSCYPWDVLGLPPVWYKSAPYRSRIVSEPRSVLKDFGMELSGDKKIRVWDSTAETRYLVIPQMPAFADTMSEPDLANLVTRDSMIGTGEVLSLTERDVNG
ncbi:MAG: nitrile hydratase subunit alpha [Burkholderiales bacterium]|nr:nitrile hydratase subunit alpha [Burkholderiales bacterium]OUT78669.1 MAG: nitrile hydratase subunit alpha [Betaproteobacteria bacterium TMED22]|tara:strand:+ start:19680 stop:20321 length:642 start_codon:yes stop_codon:yes gene_type:complete